MTCFFVVTGHSIDCHVPTHSQCVLQQSCRERGGISCVKFARVTQPINHTNAMFCVAVRPTRYLGRLRSPLARVMSAAYHSAAANQRLDFKQSSFSDSRRRRRRRLRRPKDIKSDDFVLLPRRRRPNGDLHVTRSRARVPRYEPIFEGNSRRRRGEQPDIAIDRSYNSRSALFRNKNTTALRIIGRVV